MIFMNQTKEKIEYFTVPVDFLTGIEKRIVWFVSSYYAYKTKKGTA